MKSTFIITCALSVLFVSCQSEQEPGTYGQAGLQATTQPSQQSYLALPGQAAVAVDTDTNAAFDRQVQAYAGASSGGAGSYTPAPAPAPRPASDPLVADALSTLAGASSGSNTAAAPYGTSGYNQQPATPPAYNLAPGATTHITQPQVQAVQPNIQPAAQPTGPIDYSVKIINTTTGRLFVEAQDAGGEIYPVGFLDAGGSSTVNKTQASPIKGPITVVIRDPDKPDSPEIRRYKVELPTESYANKTLGISIVPGGIYHASLDGRVYYTSPGVR